MNQELPLINGPSWVFDLVHIVVETVAGHRDATKHEMRDALRKHLQQRFVKKQAAGWITVQGDILRTEKELRKHLDWTWMDQYAIPMCVNLRILAVARERYRLTAHGEKLASSLETGAFEDTLRNVVIMVDSQEWNVLRIIKDKGPIDAFNIKAALDENAVKVRKDDHLGKYLTLLRTIGLIRENDKRPTKTYELDEERLESSSTQLTYSSYDSVSNPDFIKALYETYRERIKIGSPYVEIDDLRPRVSRLLNWPEEHFNRRLKEIPLRVGNLQLLFSQAAFPKVRSIERNGIFFDYLSIYLRER